MSISGDTKIPPPPPRSVGVYRNLFSSIPSVLVCSKPSECAKYNVADDLQLQAQYTDMLLLSKHQLCSESDMDTLHDHLSTLNEDTPRIKVSSESPITPDLVFGLDTQLFSRQSEEGVDWEKLAGEGAGVGKWHGDEVETKTLWRGGRRPGSDKGKGKGKEVDHGHKHENGDACASCTVDEADEVVEGEVVPTSRETLEAALSKLSFEIYRGTSHNHLRS